MGGWHPHGGQTTRAACYRPPATRHRLKVWLGAVRWSGVTFAGDPGESMREKAAGQTADVSASRSPASMRTGRRFSAGVSGHEYFGSYTHDGWYARLKSIT